MNLGAIIKQYNSAKDNADKFRHKIQCYIHDLEQLVQNSQFKIIDEVIVLNLCSVCEMEIHDFQERNIQKNAFCIISTKIQKSENVLSHDLIFLNRALATMELDVFKDITNQVHETMGFLRTKLSKCEATSDEERDFVNVLIINALYQGTCVLQEASPCKLHDFMKQLENDLHMTKLKDKPNVSYPLRCSLLFMEEWLQALHSNERLMIRSVEEHKKMYRIIDDDLFEIPKMKIVANVGLSQIQPGDNRSEGTSFNSEIQPNVDNEDISRLKFIIDGLGDACDSIQKTRDSQRETELMQLGSILSLTELVTNSNLSTLLEEMRTRFFPRNMREWLDEKSDFVIDLIDVMSKHGWHVKHDLRTKFRLLRNGVARRDEEMPGPYPISEEFRDYTGLSRIDSDPLQETRKPTKVEILLKRRETLRTTYEALRLFQVI